MNTSKVLNENTNDDSRFDRLVDGELTAEEYRTLLATLDEEPGAWRRCALAFLENQALSSELEGLRTSRELEDPGTDGTTSPSDGRGDLTPRPRNSPWNLRSMLAIAASFLLAFALGIAAPRFFSGPPQDGNVAGNLETQRPLSANSNSQPGVRHETLRPSGNLIGNLRLVMDGAGDESQAGKVPVYETDSGWEQFLQADQPTLAPELVQMLERRGHSVQSQKQYIPVELDDGRQIIVPFEGYQITPVGRRVY